MSIYKGTTLLAGSSITIPLLTFVWQDHKINDISWLCANTFSWQSGSVYSAVYNHLVEDIDNITATTETIKGTTITYYLAVDGHKIVLADQETNVQTIYSATGVAWYYILDTTNTRFKLPRTKYAFTGLRNTVGKYVEESLPNINGEFWSPGDYVASGNFSGAFLAGSNVSRKDSGQAETHSYPTIKFDASRSSPVYQNNATVQQRSTQMYLYFYIGQFTQTATQQTAGINSEQLNDKVDNANMEEVTCIVESYSNGTEWYRIYSDGWCEQGGIIASNTTSVSLLKSYANTNYGVLMAGFDYAANDQPIGTSAKTVSGFTVNTSTYRRYWEAKGYIS